MATTRFEDRIACSLGGESVASAQFEDSQALTGAGVLFLLPALLLQGLLKTRDIYAWGQRSYYSLESIVLTLAFMALMRIKNPEQLKQCKPGELGRIIGLDRVPEVKCLRGKIGQLTSQRQAARLNNILVDHWYGGDVGEDAGFLYIDGHVRVYYGEKANLPVKYISRQKLCLSATTEYWVNDGQGMPVMMAMGELTEKLQEAILRQIIPRLRRTCLLSAQRSDDPTPACTFIFDREAYSPAFFDLLWQEHRIAVITYRKNVRDIWPEECFQPVVTSVLEQTVTMDICEQSVDLGGHRFREIRRRSEDGHQTSIVTTHPTLPTAAIAGRMFGRWSQENFFRYMMQDYDLDRMASFGTETVDADREIVNPEYRKLTHRIKKVREKIQRLQAQFFPLAQLAMEQLLDALPKTTRKQAEYRERIDALKKEEEGLLCQRSQIPRRLKVYQMPEQQRYNRLKTESKLLMNVMRMICYRAETSVAQWIAPYLGKPEGEKRMVVKQIIESSADLTVDEERKTLTVTLHSLSANRFNVAAHELAQLLNQTETVFPGTDLTMIFKITAKPDC